MFLLLHFMSEAPQLHWLFFLLTLMFTLNSEPNVEDFFIYLDLCSYCGTTG